MLSFQEAEDLIFDSYNRKATRLKGYDSRARDLSGMEALFNRAGLLRRFAPAITVTGSKGKGSTAILSAAILRGMGYRVGLFTSPSYRCVRERIRLNGRSISEEDFARIATELAPLIRAVDAGLPADKYLSPTGLFLAIAVRYFVESAATALVLEVGRGGRFDDARLMENQVACLAPILDEHHDRLGPTVTDLAWHKTGIIRPQAIVISAPQVDEARSIIFAECERQGAELYLLGRDIHYASYKAGNRQTVTIELPYLAHKSRFVLSTPAVYQPMNLAMAYAAAAAMDQGGLDDGKIQAILDTTILPGRAQQFACEPVVFVDGAINRLSARRFRESVIDLSPAPRALITALPVDKDYSGLLDELAPCADHLIITRASAKHLRFDERVYQYARGLQDSAQYIPDVGRAFQAGLSAAGDAGAVWVVGTQSLVADALRYWQADLESIIG